MHAAVIFGLGTSHKDLKPFQQNSDVVWVVGLPASAEEADAAVIFGGDGTVHRHLASLVKLALPVLIVPAGSGNDFARALGLRTRSDSRTAWQRFARGAQNVRKIDLGVITQLGSSSAGVSPAAAEPQLTKYFCCVAGCGLDAEVTRCANQLPRWLRGHGGYAMSLPTALAKFAAFPLKLSLPTQSDGEFAPDRDQLTVLLACANTPVYGGGMKIAPQARLDDGQLAICHITDVDKFKLFCLFPTVYFGRHLSLKEVDYFHAAKLRLETQRPVDVYADGEYVCQTPVEIGVEPAALAVIVP